MLDEFTQEVKRYDANRTALRRENESLDYIKNVIGFSGGASGKKSGEKLIAKMTQSLTRLRESAETRVSIMDS